MASATGWGIASVTSVRPSVRLPEVSASQTEQASDLAELEALPPAKSNAPLIAVLGVLVFCNALRLQWTRGAMWKGRALQGARPI